MSPISAEPTACKICRSPAALYGVVDFNKHGSEDRTGRFSLSGIPIYYRRCAACSFIFSDAFDAWTAEDFRARIYNDDYVKVDPDYAEKRPRDNAGRIIKRFGPHRAEISCLDYGGGNGLLTALLRQANFTRAETYDQHSPVHGTLPGGPFDLVTCFEVFEHEPNPHALVETLARLIGNEGLIYFSTLLQPDDIDKRGVSWWYIAPRNGHVSIYSRRSLDLVLRQHGLNCGSFNSNLHLAWNKVPAFGAQFFAASA